MTETNYLGRDNSIDLILRADGVAVDLAAVTQMKLKVGTTTVTSANLITDPILWAKAGYDTGEIRMFLGGLVLTAGDYFAPLVVYDAAHPLGIVWGYVPITIVANPI